MENNLTAEQIEDLENRVLLVRHAMGACCDFRVEQEKILKLCEMAREAVLVKKHRDEMASLLNKMAQSLDIMSDEIDKLTKERDAAVARAVITPCSERHPKFDTDVLAIYATGDSEVAQYREDRHCMLGPGAGECGVGWVSKEAGYLPIDGIVGWMPLPVGPGVGG